jgi:crotonobetainyl-CoA:carnitine CoA-transferase CaiB-like acyl-CoA transferase
MAVADTVTAMTATQATLAALFERERTGSGRLVSVNLVESMLAFNAEPISRSINEGAVTDEFSRASESQAFAVSCKDHQRIGIHLSSPPKFWDALIRALDAPELGTDDRFTDRKARVSNYEALAGELQRRFKLRNRDEWIPILQQNDVPFAPAYEIADVASDPHISATGAFVAMETPGIGPSIMVERPFRFDDSRGVPHVPPPFLGQHNELLLKRFGLTETEMNDLKEAKIIL